MSRLTARLALAATALFATPIAAQTVTATPGTEYVIHGTVDEVATGASMSGMHVTATFSDGQSFTQDWGFLGLGNGVDYGVQFSNRLRISHNSGDSFLDGNWYMKQLATPRVTKLVFDGIFGNTVFDRARGFFGLDVGTPGSNIGGDYYDVNALWSASTAQYSNIVSVAPNAPMGDLYRTFTLTFDSQLPLDLINGGRGVAFSMDSDTIRPAATVTPEPASIALLGLGVVGVGLVARRRRA